MNDFRFRAAAALELRRRQEQQAATALAQAEAELRASERRSAEAGAARRTAQEELQSVERQGSDVMTLLWHRNWIVKLSNDLAERLRQRTLAAEAVQGAEQRWQQARQRRLALDRMHERALRRFKQDQLREEMKVIDELARLRYVIAEAGRDDS